MRLPSACGYAGEAEPRNFEQTTGKPKAFRKEGGEAAE